MGPRLRNALIWLPYTILFLALTILSSLEWTTPLGPAWQSVTGHATRSSAMGSFPMLFGTIFCIFAGMMIATAFGFGPIKPAELALDEGGIRYFRQGRRGYIPFCTVRDISPVLGVVGSRVRVVHADGVETFRLSQQIAGTGGLLEEMLKRVRDAKAARTCPEALQRKDVAFDAWLEQLDRVVDESKGYRSAALQTSELEAIARDVACDPESRAAAMYVLLSLAGAEDRDRLRGVLGPDAPPHLLCVARLAPGGEALVPAAVEQQARSFLDDSEREAIARIERAARQPGTPEKKVRVEVAPEPPPADVAEPEPAEEDAPEERRHMKT
jgi:hypothetical protein